MATQKTERRKHEPPAPSVNRPVRLLWIALAVAFATFAVYARSIPHPFVVWDDEANFVNNPAYRGLGSAQLEWMFTTFHLGPYQPLSWMTLGLDYLLWGMDATGYHLTNVLLHATAAGVVFALVATLVELRSGVGSRGARLFGLAVALLWAWHPLRVEAVSWVTERREVLSGLLVFTTLLLHARGARWWWVALTAALAMLAKGTALAVAPLLVLVDVYGAPVGTTSDLMRVVLRSKLRHAVVFTCAVVVGLLAIRGQQSVDAMVSMDALGVGERLRIFGNSLGFYVVKTVWPSALAPMYDPPADRSVLTVPAVLGALGVLAACALAWSQRRRVGPLWTIPVAYAGLVALVGGLMQVGNQLVADRYAYQPGFVSVLGVVTLVTLLGARAWPTMLRVGVLAIACGLLAWRCIEQQSIWSGSAALWRHELAHYPDSPIAHLHMGLLQVEGKLPESTTAEAEAHFRAAIARSPGYGDAWCALGDLLGRAGRYEEALSAYQAAVTAQPTHRAGLQAFANLGWQLGQREPALEKLLHLRDVAPNDFQSHLLLGRMLAAAGRPREALPEYERALALAPHVLRPSVELAWFLSTNPDDSVRNGNRALQLAESALRTFGTSDPLVVHARTAALAEVGRFDEAQAFVAQIRSHLAPNQVQGFDGAFEAVLGSLAQHRPLRVAPTFP